MSSPYVNGFVQRNFSNDPGSIVDEGKWIKSRFKSRITYYDQDQVLISGNPHPFHRTDQRVGNGYVFEQNESRGYSKYAKAIVVDDADWARLSKRASLWEMEQEIHRLNKEYPFSPDSSTTRNL